jgi:hypothetical protein
MLVFAAVRLQLAPQILGRTGRKPAAYPAGITRLFAVFVYLVVYPVGVDGVDPIRVWLEAGHRCGIKTGVTGDWPPLV